jgi:membrane-associated two-gene conflict system component 1 (EACC1)
MVRLYVSVDSSDAAALPELREWLDHRASDYLEQLPRPISQPDPAGMSAVVTILEILAASAELVKLIMALAKRHETGSPAAVVQASWPDGRKFRIESSDPETVAEIVRALGGS